MTSERTLKRHDVATRWGVSPRTIDRLRQAGKLPWIDISGRRGERPIVRFALLDVEQYEQRMRQSTAKPEQTA